MTYFVFVPGGLAGRFYWRDLAARLMEQGHAVEVIEKLPSAGHEPSSLGGVTDDVDAVRAVVAHGKSRWCSSCTRPAGWPSPSSPTTRTSPAASTSPRCSRRGGICDGPHGQRWRAHGRVTTFPYTEITGIEYNAGLLSGVLEVLTPSDSGTSNKDYWRGTLASRNANADDPWTLSNTLPMPRNIYQQALPRLNEMRARIADAKRPQFVVAAPQPAFAAPTSVADELGKLAGLRDQGVLSDAEFQSAKQRVLAQHGLA